MEVHWEGKEMKILHESAWVNWKFAKFKTTYENNKKFSLIPTAGSHKAGPSFFPMLFIFKTGKRALKRKSQEKQVKESESAA